MWTSDLLNFWLQSLVKHHYVKEYNSSLRRGKFYGESLIQKGNAEVEAIVEGRSLYVIL